MQHQLRSCLPATSSLALATVNEPAPTGMDKEIDCDVVVAPSTLPAAAPSYTYTTPSVMSPIDVEADIPSPSSSPRAVVLVIPVWLSL